MYVLRKQGTNDTKIISSINFTLSFFQNRSITLCGVRSIDTTCVKHDVLRLGRHPDGGLIAFIL